MTRGGYVCILTNRPRDTLHLGVTANLEKRLSEHRLGVGSKFTHRYNLHRPVHSEAFDRIEYAIARDKQLKSWRREWKLELVERVIAHWFDLSKSWWQSTTTSQPPSF